MTIEVIPSIPVDSPLSYLASQSIPIGTRVVVGLKNRQVVGLVVGSKPNPLSGLRRIERVLDGSPIVPEGLLSFFRWVASYYFTPIGKVIRTALPPGWFKEDKEFPTIEKNTPIKIAQDLLLSIQRPFLKDLTLWLSKSVFRGFLLPEADSKKRIVYLIKAVELALAHGLTSLVLVPEIVDLDRLRGPFEDTFGSEVLIYSSAFSEKGRQEVWLKSLLPGPKIILGTRSAVFLPLTDLGLVIVEKEYSFSYWKKKGFRYQARDLAVVRAKMANAKIILAGNFLSSRSYYLANIKRYHWLIPWSLSKRNRRIEVVDLSHERGYISRKVLNAIRMTIAHRQKALVFLNRLGFSPVLICKGCGHLWQCPRCKVSLAYHRGARHLLCHYCGFCQPAPPVCTNCGMTELRFLGAGTERIEKILSRLFPQAKIVRVDSEAVKGKRALNSISKQIRDVDIIVGTKLVKRLGQIKDLGLVSVLLADQDLRFPDFQAAERTMESLVELAELLSDGGRLIIQTYYPEHYVIQSFCSGDYRVFYHEELKRRKMLGFPPFSCLALIELKGKSEAHIEEGAFRVRNFLEMVDGLEVLGPVKAPFYQVKGFYRWHLLIKSPKFDILHTNLQKLKDFPPLVPKGVQLIFIVDPQEML